jgi:hypothetical protein
VAPGRVDITDEDFIISFDNFLYASDTGRAWTADHEHVNVLPRSFSSFCLRFGGGGLVRAVVEKTDFPVSPHLNLLGSAALITSQSGNSPYDNCFDPRVGFQHNIGASQQGLICAATPYAASTGRPNPVRRTSSRGGNDERAGLFGTKTK